MISVRTPFNQTPFNQVRPERREPGCPVNGPRTRNTRIHNCPPPLSKANATPTAAPPSKSEATRPSSSGAWSGGLPDDVRPASSERREAGAFFRPVVKSGWIEVSAVRPDECLRLGVQPDLIEDLGLRKRAEYLSRQHGPKIDLLGRSVLELDPQGEGCHPLESDDYVNCMGHACYLNRSILAGCRPACKASQFSSSSARWISAHAVTSRACRAGRFPPMISMSSTANTPTPPW